ncbi:MAG: biotin transporter BioY [Alphaproteobacteria bacterium]|nr:biotin transporter BioY [Alphaproteobacteria bacterium]
MARLGAMTNGMEKFMTGFLFPTTATQPATGSTRLLSLLLILAASGLLAICAQLAIPLKPVPLSFQTLGLITVGITLGWRLGFLATLTYLAEGALGLPVFAHGTGGIHLFMGPTAGYLLSFPFVALIAGWTSQNYLSKLISSRNLWVWLGASLLVLMGFVLSLMLCLLAGGAWLAVFLQSTNAAWNLGIQPFLFGEGIKALLALFALQAAARLKR